MGASFVNVQVRVAASTAASDVAQALCEVLADQGFVQANEGKADRTVVVRPGAPWVAVYDERSEESFDDAGGQLARALSERLATQACVILVHDSSVLELALFYGGVPLDRFNSQPDYFTKPSAAERKALAGRPDAWSGVLRAGTTPAELRRAWRKRPAFAEDTLTETAELLELGADNARIGYRYSLEEPRPDDLVLVFRHRVPKPAPPEREGPPRFAAASSGPPRVDVALGGTLLNHVSVRNYGGAGQGVKLFVRGNALKLVTLDEVELIVSIGERTTRQRATWQPDRSGEPATCMASFPDVRISAATGPALPPGFALADPSTLDDASKQVLMLAMMALDKGAMELEAHLHARGKALGEGSLSIGLVPTEAPQQRHDFDFGVRVLPAAHHPLRGLADGWVVPRLPEDMLLALCSFDLDPVRAAAVAARLIERFGACFGASDQLTLTLFPAEARRRARTSSAKRRDFFASRRWQKLVADLPLTRQVSLVCEAERVHFHDPPRSDGAKFGGSLASQEASTDPELPTLALWCNLEAASPEQRRAVRQLAEDLMTEVMLDHSGVQATVAYLPSSTEPSLESTWYEARSGIHTALRRSWLERFVRHVGVGTVWLGESHLARLPDRSALERSARVHSFPRSLKIAIDSDEQVPAVEAAIFPLLPSV